MTMTTQVDIATDADFRAAITLGVDVPDEQWRFFTDRCRQVNIAARGMILDQRRCVSDMWYIHRGLVRLFCVHDDREHTFGFDRECRCCGDYVSFLTGAPATLSIQAIEDCSLIMFNAATIQKLYGRSPQWVEIGRLQAEYAVIKKYDKEQRFRLMTPQQRYDDLLIRAPYILHRVPQYLQASYLGVTPETLSRIRARQS